jgi:cyclopropane fatty-acyl-phospholipid synthase-like methyltransferase
MTPELDRADILAFWQQRGASESPAAARFHTEHTAYDMAAILRLCRPEMHVLDLGCGTCVIGNLLLKEIDLHIHAVDVVPGFLEHASPHPNLTTEVADIIDYRSESRYDLILLLGVINSIPREQDRMKLYRNCRAILAPQGMLFVKSQFGIAETVIVDRGSEHPGLAYKAIYPALDEEVVRLRSLFSVDVSDPYPTALNKHWNTHFHYLFCTVT